MLCKFCHDFDFDQLASSEGYPHHTSWIDLYESAAQGCEVCQLVRAAARGWQDPTDHHRLYVRIESKAFTVWRGDRSRPSRANLGVYTTEG